MSGMADGLVVFEGPADLAMHNARLPTVFLTDAKANERFWDSLRPTFAIRTRGAPTTRPCAVFRTSAKDEDYSTWRR
jgi:hypothetical protein